MTIVLNERQLLLVNPLKAKGDWMTARDLALALGRDQLAPEQFIELDHLSDLGLVVKEISADKAPKGEDIRYRYSEPKVEPKKDRA